MSAVDKANAALLVQLLNRLGINTDIAGSNTVFARLSQISGFTDQLEAFVDSVEGILGTSADAAGAATVFAQLKRIYDAVDQVEGYTDGIEAKTNLIGAAADAAGTTTLFARLAQIAGYVDQVEGAIGVNTDVAGTGTVFAQLQRIYAAVDQVEGFTDSLETSIGTNADPAGTTTLFARLAQIAGFVDQVEGFTDSIETLLGLTGDVASGTGTIMARLAQLIGYTDTLETVAGQIKAKTDLIGAAADAAGTGTVFARLVQSATEMAAARTDIINTYNRANAGASAIGANTDAASMASTVFAALKALNAKSGGLDLSAMTPNFYNYAAPVTLAAAPTTPGSSSLDLFTINGSGIISDLKLAFGASSTNTWGFSIVIDGVEKLLHTNLGNTLAHRVTDAGFTSPTSTAAVTNTEVSSIIKFNSSFTVRLRNYSGSGASNNAVANIVYHT